MTSASNSTLTGNPNIDGILVGSQWSSKEITFSFPTAGSQYTGYERWGEPSSFSALTSEQQAAVRAALKQYAGVAQLTFKEVTDAPATATLRFGNSSKPWTALAYYPNSNDDRAGDVWFGTRNGNAYGHPVTGSYGWETFMHEIGHALGLKHGQEGTQVNPAVLPYQHDSLEWSVMTYRSYVGADLNGYTNARDSYPQSLMRNDIAAIQSLYGANYDTESGDTIYSFDEKTGVFFINGASQGPLAGARIFRTIWDGGGNDTYDFHNFSKGMTIDLRPGEGSVLDWSLLANLNQFESGHLASANVYNAYLFQGDRRSLIENAIGGAGADLIIGNEAANRLVGNGGDDTLFGNDGNDTLLGGDGNDDLTGGAGDDVVDGGVGTNVAHYAFALSHYRVSLNLDMSLTIVGLGDAAADGVDTVRNVSAFYFQSIKVTFWDLLVQTGILTIDDSVFRADYIFRANDRPSNFSFVGGSAADTLFGAQGNDLLVGKQGGDLLDGGEGADTLDGGDGWDTLTGGAGADVFVFRATPGDGDTITDFTVGVDRIDLSALTGPDGRHLSFAGSRLLDGEAGTAYDSATGLLSVDWTADGKADLQIQLGKNLALSAADFRF